MFFNDLSPEILIQILSLTDSLADLDSLARASRRTYAVFRSDQACLIYQALAAELGPVLPDALGLSLIQAVKANSAGFIPRVLRAIAQYGQLLSGRGDGVAAAGGSGTGAGGGGTDGEAAGPGGRRSRLSLGDVLRLVRRYRAVACMADVYETCTLAVLRRELLPTCPRGPPCPGVLDNVPGSAVLLAPLSRTERWRMLRACYRLQIFLHAGLHCRGASNGFVVHNPSIYAGISLHDALLRHWALWEQYQVLCAGEFHFNLAESIRHVYCLNQWINLKLDSTWYTGWYSEKFRAGIRERRAGDEAAWQETLRQASSSRAWGMAWYFDQNYRCRLCAPLPSGRLPTALDFDGDCVDSAPFGWVDAFGGDYTYDYWEERAMTRESRWFRVGSLFWDASRCKALEASSLLSRCKTGWAHVPGGTIPADAWRS